MKEWAAPLAVFAGGCLGGALRLGIDAVVPATSTGIPLDVIAINVSGAFAMGVLAAWVMVHGARWWAPMLGTGALGAFTTFSAIAALPWLSTAGAVPAVSLLAATLVASVATAAAGWGLGVRLALAQERRSESAP
ncbi:fluoride efflux transporter FluC [Demequina sp. SO4-18]|uniref:fluoride efflux transporter FluC n=1 Tax=Demequina sp. SO4-18 TaxID=3401026 RepID=UPI003B598168